MFDLGDKETGHIGKIGLTMKSLPDYVIKVYGNADALPEEAEELFRKQLEDSYAPLPADRVDREEWRFALTCAVAAGGHVLGGVYLDIGPINGVGPLAKERLGYLERTFVRPEYRRRGLEAHIRGLN